MCRSALLAFTAFAVSLFLLTSLVSAETYYVNTATGSDICEITPAITMVLSDGSGASRSRRSRDARPGGPCLVGPCQPRSCRSRPYETAPKASLPG